MSVTQCLDWVVGLLPRFIDLLKSFEFADGVNVFNFNIALWIMMILIVSFVPRP